MVDDSGGNIGVTKCCECRNDTDAAGPKCDRCDGLGWYNEMGPNTFPIRCMKCERVFLLRKGTDGGIA